MPSAAAARRSRHSVPNTPANTASVSRPSIVQKGRHRASAAQPSASHGCDATEAVTVSKPKRRRTEPPAQQQREEMKEREDESSTEAFTSLDSLLSSLQSLYADAESSSSSSSHRRTLRERLDGLLQQLCTLAPSPALPQLLPEDSIAAVQSSAAAVAELAPRAKSVASHLALPLLQLQDISASPTTFSPVHIHALLHSSALHLCRHLQASLSSPVSKVSVSQQRQPSVRPPAQFEAVTAVPRVAALNRRGDRIKQLRSVQRMQTATRRCPVTQRERPQRLLPPSH